MTRVFIGSSLIRASRRLDRVSRTNLERELTEVARHSGEPQRHSGIGLRKLTQDAWECRLDIRWRILFVQEADGLMAYDIMDHSEVRAWLRGKG